MLEMPPEEIVEEVPPAARQDAAGGHACRAGIIGDDELKETLCRAASPMASGWISNLVRLRELPIPNKRVEPVHTRGTAHRLQKAFGYTYEDVQDTILPMAQTGAEPTGAMGIDIPLAVLSRAMTSRCSTTSSSSSPR